MSLSDEKFQDLALRTLAGEVSPEEKTSLDALLARDPARQREFQELRETWIIAQAAGPMAASFDAKDAELPAYRMGQLRSAVRTHFKNQAVENAPSTAQMGWLKIFSNRFALGGGLFAACIVLIFILMPRPTDIEIGLYAEPATRSADNEAVVQSTDQVHVNQFENDKTFEQWRAQPFTRNEKARIWIDEEHDLIRVRFPSTLLAPAREETHPLPESAPARKAVIASLIDEIQKN